MQKLKSKVLEIQNRYLINELKVWYDMNMNNQNNQKINSILLKNEI